MNAGVSSDIYIELLKKVLMGRVYTADMEYHPLQARIGTWSNIFFEPIARLLASKSLYLYRSKRVTEEMWTNGTYWPSQGFTMVGRKRLDHVQHCVETVLREGIAGDLVETGVWRGGVCMLMQAILKLHGDGRRIFLADSFRGLPKPETGKYEADQSEVTEKYALWRHRQLAVSRQQVEANFRQLGLFDNNLVFVEGWFRDTLPTAPIGKISLLRLDGDYYESTMDGLVHLYPKLAPGGFLIVDDYGSIKACADAVHDYRRENGVTEEMASIDRSGVFWRKKKHPEAETAEADNLLRRAT
jgi:O-methyltransferase